MDNQVEIIPYNGENQKTDNINNNPFSNNNSKYNSLNKLLFNAKKTQVNLLPFKTITTIKSIGFKNKLMNPEMNNHNQISHKKNETINNDILNLKYSFRKDKSFSFGQKNDKNIKKNYKLYISTSNKEEKNNSNYKEKNVNDKNEEKNIKTNIDKLYIINKNNKDANPQKGFSNQRNHDDRNFVPMIKRMTFNLINSGYTDISLKNWNDLKKNYIEHVKNQKLLNKYDKQNLAKSHFNSKNYRKFYFGRKNIEGLPYYYDITSTYMNRYQNKSEHNRHEILIDELCKLRAYLLKFKEKNNTEIIKDFLIKHNMPDMNKYTNYQLLQFGRFVCQEDIYKINSLLKPYMHVKDMIKDILENSENLNGKFSTFKFNSSIKNLLSNLKTNKSQPILIRTPKSPSKKIVNPHIKKNKKFYISELDYIANKNKSRDKTINNITQNEDNSNQNSLSFINSNVDEEKNVFENTKKDFNIYSQKRKEILNNIGIQIRHVFKHIDNKESYFSPLFNNNIFQDYYKINNKKIKLPKISNNIGSFYKPNKLLLSPDKNYSLNFALLFKDVSNELNNFQSNYERKFDVDIQRDVSKNLSHSKSSENLNISSDVLIKKKLEENNRLYFGKKNIKADLEEIQKKHKLTEYFALINAKNHIKDEIINDNIINY